MYASPSDSNDLPDVPKGRMYHLFVLIGCVLIGAFGLTIPAQASTEGVVISQLYTYGGEELTSVYTYDYIELFNAGSAAVTLTGWSLQIAIDDGAFNEVLQINLPAATLQVGQYYLVQLAGGNNTVQDLPTPDLITTSTLHGPRGKVALMRTQDALPGEDPTTENLVDFIGYGGTIYYEGEQGAAPAPAVDTALLRANSGCTDTEDNAADITSGTPAPRNATTALNPCTDVDMSPTVDSTTPADDATGVPVDAVLTVTFSEIVTVNGAWFSITCAAGGAQTGTASGSGASYTITPDANLPDDDTCTVTLDAASISDTDGNTMSADYVWSFSTGASVNPGDDTPPSVTRTIPANNTSAIPLNQNLAVTFSEAVSVNGAWYNLTCSASGTVAAAVSGGPQTYIIDPLVDFTNAEMCSVQITASRVTDAAGNPLPADETWSFTTVLIGGDRPPYVTGTAPVNGAGDVPLSTDLTVTFNEDVVISAQTFTLDCSISEALTVSVEGGAQQFVINPDTDLAQGDRCIARVNAAQVNDIDGTEEGMAADYLWSFVTVGAVVDDPPAVTSTFPTDDAAGVPVDANLSVNFSESVNAAPGAFTLECSRSGAHSVTASGGPQNYTLNPLIDFEPGETCSAVVLAAQVVDLDGTPDYMLADYAWTFSTVDTAPSVNVTTPADGAVDVPASTNIAVNFSEPVTAPAQAFTINCLTTGVQVFSLSGSGQAYILDPTAGLPAGDTCSITVAAAQVSDLDLTPQPMDADYTFSFTTIPDNPDVVDTPPEVVAVTPANGTTGVAVDTLLSITFSEDVATQTGAFVLDCTTSGAVALAITGGPQDFTLDPETDLTHNETCTATVQAAQIYDVDYVEQNPMTTDFVWNFQIVAADPTVTPPAVTAVSPPDQAQTVALDTTITVTFNEDVAVSGTWYTITCTSSSTVTAAVSGGPRLFTLTPSADLMYGETCTVTILAAQVSDVDTPPSALAADYVWQFATLPEPTPDCQQPFTPIYTIQGEGAATPLSGEVTTQGVITGVFPDGVYIQDAAGDANPLTSDGLFINLTAALSPGQVVRVTGTVSEQYGQTRLDSPSIIDCGTTGTVTPVPLTLPFTNRALLEQYEGMLVTLPQTLTVTGSYTLGRFGELMLSSGGRLFQPTQITAPGTDAADQAAANALNMLLLDDGSSATNPTPPPYLPVEGTRRVGDTVQGITGVLAYNFGDYRVYPTEAPVFIGANVRPVQPPVVGGTLRVASLNAQNYFNGPDFPTPRGATTPDAFALQRAKLAVAITALDADIIGLMEIENDGYGVESALQDLVNALPGYAFIVPDVPTGSDAITVALIYRTTTVTPVGDAAVTNAPPFDLRRPPLAQSFRQNATDEVLTIAVNHWKSKSCADASGANADQGDGQGCWNAERVQAAQTLLNWLATDPTQSGDPDVLVIGDLNAYAQEDPITTLQAAGYTNLLALYQTSYSYVFDGASGTLDYALSSPALLPQVTGVAAWHINADEPPLFAYDGTLPDASFYRASDHDPLLIGLNLTTDDQYGDTLQLIAPVGTVAAGYGNPTFEWTRLADATEYQFYLARVDAMLTPVLYDIIPAAPYCGPAAVCTLDWTTLDEAYRLLHGDYIVFLRAWLDGTPGGWAGAFTFTLDAAPPEAVTLDPVTALDRSRPVFHWRLPDNAAFAAWFRVYVAPQDDLAAPLINDWFARADVCGDVHGTVCTLESPVDLSTGSYGLYIGSWGPGGLSIGGLANSGFAGIDFTISAGLPPVPQGLTLSQNQGRPTFSWPLDDVISWYQLVITNTAGDMVHMDWVDSRACTVDRCTVTPETNLLNGGYAVRLRGWGAAGFSGWTAPASFTLNFPPPPAVESTAVMNANSGEPVFTWDGVPGALWYQLLISTADGESVSSDWHLAAELGCENTGPCTLKPLLALPNGSYRWYLGTWGPGGPGAGWSQGEPFIVAASPTGSPVPGTPDTTTNRHNPAFRWAHVENVVWYNLLVEHFTNFTPAGVVHDGWYRADDLGCTDDRVCTLESLVLNLPNGDYAWSLRGYNPAGIGEWSAKQTFSINR